MSGAAALSYEEPGIATILIQSSFLLLLNVVNWILDNAIYCGLLGQVLMGIAWGTPGTGWLPLEVQDTVMQLGYLGLILVIYEGRYERTMYLERVIHTVYQKKIKTPVSSISPITALLERNKSSPVLTTSP